MDYEVLANEFLETMYLMHKNGPQKKFDEAVRGELFTLQFIYRHGENILPNEISNEIDVSTARIAAVLNNLEKKGLITRQIDVYDRRKILVNLTQIGKETAEKQIQDVSSYVVKLIEQLGEKDTKEYLRISNRLIQIMQKFNERAKK